MRLSVENKHTGANVTVLSNEAFLFSFPFQEKNTIE